MLSELSSVRSRGGAERRLMEETTSEWLCMRLTIGSERGFARVGLYAASRQGIAIGMWRRFNFPGFSGPPGRHGTNALVVFGNGARIGNNADGQFRRFAATGMPIQVEPSVYTHPSLCVPL